MKSLKQRLDEAAVPADLNPRISKILCDFFLKLATQADKDELDEWLNATEANSYYFDLLLEATKKYTNTATIALITKHGRKPAAKMSWVKRVLWALVILSLLLILVNYLLPSHPMHRLITGVRFGQSALGLDSVSTQATPKTVWLVDSTRVDLGPNSTIRFPNELSWYRRSVQVFGQATIYIHGKANDDFLVVYGKLEEPFNADYRITCDSAKMIIQPLNP